MKIVCGALLTFLSVVSYAELRETKNVAEIISIPTRYKGCLADRDCLEVLVPCKLHLLEKVRWSNVRVCVFQRWLIKALRN